MSDQDSWASTPLVLSPFEADTVVEPLDDSSKELFHKLKAAIDAESRAPLFTCGGSIPIAEALVQGAGSSGAATTPVESPPVAVRWDSPGELSENARLFFPVGEAMKPNLDRLVKTMTPAGFGRGDKHVFDEAYRKAAKMDPTSFSTSFNPYELGIVDAIAQTLLPSAKAPEDFRSVRAELYKLNVYSGPSGKFKAHVDTPRSTTQFGTLVVCLPVEHEGGQLQVRHNGSEMTFDWGGGSSPGRAAIQWAAFYSDCEHEVLHVKSGHRITLTYNLYSIRGNPTLTDHAVPGVLDPGRSPVHGLIDSVLQEPGLLPEGGVLGFFCTRAYPHSASDSGLPSMLKGVDMMLWESLKALGLRPQVRPVIVEDYDDPEFWDQQAWDKFLARRRKEYNKNQKQLWWKDRYGDKPLAELPRELPRGWITRGPVKSSVLDTMVGDGDAVQDHMRLMVEWMEEPASGVAYDETVEYNKVLWLSKPRHKQPAFQHMAYGNEPSVHVIYSHCSITVRIGKPGSRGAVDAPPNPAKRRKVDTE